MEHEQFVLVNKERFLSTINHKKISIRKLGTTPSIGKCEKTIRTYLNNGEFPYITLNRIGQFLNIDPMFLAGEYDKIFEKIEDEEIVKQLKVNLNPDNYPYIRSMQTSIGFEQHFKNILTMSGINWEQYQLLPTSKKIMLRQEMNVAIQSVIHNYFDTDSFGNNTSDILAYFEGMVGDLSPEDLEFEGEKIDWPYWLKKSK